MASAYIQMDDHDILNYYSIDEISKFEKFIWNISVHCEFEQNTRAQDSLTAFNIIICRAQAKKYTMKGNGI